MRKTFFMLLAAIAFVALVALASPALADCPSGSSERGLVAYRGQSLGPWGQQRCGHQRGGYRYGGPVYYQPHLRHNVVRGGFSTGQERRIHAEGYSFHERTVTAGACTRTVVHTHCVGGVNCTTEVTHPSCS